jgi:hypothetical protein
MKKLLLVIGLIAGGFIAVAHAGDSPGFAKDFIARVGDLNGDGRLDIFLQQQKPKVVQISLDDLTFPVPLRPDVGEFVLQQNAAGEFNLVSTLTAQAKQAIKQWAIQSAIKVIARDLNIDGVVDVLLGGVGSVIPGGKNVIVFASPTVNGPPTVVRNVDSVLDKFIKDVGGFSDNPNYFASGVGVQCGTVYIRTLHYDSYTLEYYYTYDPYWVCQYVFDPSGFSIPAINFLNRFVPIANSGQLVAQTSDAISVSQQLRNLFGIDFFKNALEQGGSGGVPWCEDVPWPELDRCDGYGRLGELVDVLRDLTTGARDSVSCSHGVDHHYALAPDNGAISMCELGHPSISPFCSTANAYREQLTHPVLGYIRNRTPIRDGQPGVAQFGFWGTWDDGGPLVFHVDKPRLWHQNETLPGHIFYHGWVNRQTIVENNKVYITTEGGGDGDCKTFNEIFGSAVFRSLDVLIWNHLQSGVTQSHDPIP